MRAQRSTSSREPSPLKVLAAALLVVVPAEHGTAQLLRNLRSFRSRLSVGAPEVPAVRFWEGPKGVAAGDLDVDGDPDIAVSNLDGTVTVYLNAGPAAVGIGAEFDGPIHLRTGMESLRGIIIEDLNLDDSPDIATAAPFDGTLVIFWNLGGGNFSPALLVEAWEGARNLAPVYDGTGMPGIALAGTNLGLRQYRVFGFVVPVVDLPGLDAEAGAFPRPVYSLRSFGRVVVPIIQDGETWSYFKGTEAPPPGWNELGFDDAAWLSGPTGIGYGDGDDVTMLADMQGNYVTVFCRKSFEVPDVDAIGDLLLNVRVDDGFCAYLNGAEVAAHNVSNRNWDALADSVGEPTLVVRDISGFKGLLQDGANVLAVQVHNGSMVSSDLTFIPQLLNRTGRGDLVVTHAVSDRAWVLGAGPTGELEVQGEVPSVEGAYYLDVGPVTRDAGSAIPDLVTAHRDLGTVEVRRGIPGPSRFAENDPQVLHIPGGPRAVKIVDLDRDGWNDLAVVVRYFDEVRTYRNDNGTLVPAHQMPVGSSPRDLAVADFDGDDWPDLAVINRISSDIDVLYGHPHAVGFSALDQYQLVDGEVVDLGVVDLNRDGRGDVVQLHRSSWDLSVRRADAEGLLGPPVFYPMGPRPTALAIADVNNDGLPDAVSANLGICGVTNGSLSARLGTPLAGGLFREEIRSPLSPLPPELEPLNKRLLLHRLAMGDFDGDGRIDAAAAFLGSRLGFFRGRGNGRFDFQGTLHRFFQTRVIVAGDFDRDGDVDLAGADCGGNLGVVRNNRVERAVDLLTAPALEERQYGSSALTRPPVGDLKALDLDRDGDLDLVLGSGNGLVIFEHTEGLRFRMHPEPLSGTDVRVSSLASGDFDGDGRVDLAAADRIASSVTIFTRTSDGQGPTQNFTVRPAADVPAGAVITSGDLDGDRRDDLVGSGRMLWTALSRRPASLRSPPPSRGGTRLSIPGVVINEVFPHGTETREQGWIELFNNSGRPVNLRGWTLEIEVADWSFTFPEDLPEIPPQALPLVLFSDPVITPDDVAVELPQDRGKLVLRQRDGRTVDEVDLPAMFENVSYARYEDGLPALVLNPYPSPEQPNTHNGTLPPIAELEDIVSESVLSGGEAIPFSARARDDVGIASVSVLYRRLDVEDSDFHRLFLHDDGLHGDGEMQDGLFSGTIAEGLLPPGAEILFYLEVLDLNGAVERVPGRASPAAAEGFAEAYSLALGVDLPPLEISELVPRNRHSLTDEAGASPDWAEIRNCSARPVSFEGVFLGENYPSTEDWFEFPPDLVLQPGDHVVVFCDRDPEEGPLHAPFRLSGDGGLLVLVGTGPSGGYGLIDWVDFPAGLDQDRAWARSRCGGGWLEADPSPGTESPFHWAARGDVDGSGRLTVTDATKVLELLFQETRVPCPRAAEINGDATVDISDAVYLLLHLYAGGPPPRGDGPVLCD